MADIDYFIVPALAAPIEFASLAEAQEAVAPLVDRALEDVRIIPIELAERISGPWHPLSEQEEE
jgi:hypothetical protein